MKAQTVDVRDSTGKILCCTVFRPGGRKLLAKGHQLSEEDVHLLETEGLKKVWVTVLEDGEIAENEAVTAVAQGTGCGCTETRIAAGGRANLFATEDCCLLVDDDLLRQINRTSSIAIATLRNFEYARAGDRIATIKSTPFAAPAAELESVMTLIRTQGPLLQARPIRQPSVAVLYTDINDGERARQLFGGIMQQRLSHFGVQSVYELSSLEEEMAVSRALQQIVSAAPTAILVASTTAPAGPDDVIGRAMVRIGSQIERFLAPVEPGNLFLLSYKSDIPVVSAPGCFRSAKPNIVDLVLPPMLARYRISGWELACLGHGGLLI